MKVKTFMKPFFAVGLLCFCVYFLYNILVTSSWIFPKFYDLKQPDAETQKEFPSAVFRLYRKCQFMGVSLVAMDTVILSSAVNKPHTPWHNTTMFTFGVFENEMAQMDEVSRSRAFLELEFTSEKIRGNAVEPKNIACFLFRFRRTTLSMRVMVVYRRDGMYRTRDCDKDMEKTSHGTIMEAFRTKSVSVYNTSVLVPEMTSAFLAQLPFSVHVTCQKTRPEVGLNEDGKTSLEAVMHLTELARKMGKTLFLFYGSLLGWYRDCSFLDSVDHNDLAMFADDFDKEFHLALLKSPNISGQVYGKPSNGLHYELKLYGARTDISLVYRDSKTHMLWTGRVNMKTKQQLRLFYPHFTVCSAVAYGGVVHVPCPTVPVLKFEYGTSWNRSANPRDRQYMPKNVIKDDPWRSTSQLMARDLSDPTVI